METQGLRIHAYLAQMGLASRRKVEDYIQKGYIQVNGKPARLGQIVHPAKDALTFKGKQLNFPKIKKIVVVAVNKPRGVVSTSNDPERRAKVVDMVPKNLGRLYPVGRLDLMSEGLILLTNDGDLSYRLTHPKFEIPKTYEVKIRGRWDGSKQEYLEKGIRIGKEKFEPAKILSVREAARREGVEKTIITIQIHEGKYHHIRRLFEALKCHVIRLKRVSMGPVTIKGIPLGGYRVLSKARVEELHQFVGNEA
jgi:pseudouridine synthase